jgi:hypothetical protein
MTTSAGTTTITDLAYNNKGQLIQETNYRPCNHIRYKYNFEYTGNNLTQMTAYISEYNGPFGLSSRSVFEWSNGNIITSYGYNPANQLVATTSYVYDMTQPNLLRTFRDFWLYDMYDKLGSIRATLNQNKLVRYVDQGANPCIVQTWMTYVFNEHRIERMWDCGAYFWVFTYAE